MATAVSPRTAPVVAVAGVVLITAYAGFVGWSAGWASYDAWGGLVVVPLLLMVSIPMLLRAGRRDPDPRFLKLLVWAFVLKALATVMRYLMAFVLYGGVADSLLYHEEGDRLATAYRAGDFGAEIGRNFIGTGFIRVFTGAIYTVTGPSIFVAYAVYSWLGFWGLYLLYRAFRITFHDGDHRRYAKLVLFLPSMLFWPSGLGKEAWMTLGLGLAAYGAAKLYQGHRGWWLPLLAGLVATGVVRPHITACVFAGIAFAYLLGKRSRPATELTPLVVAAAVGMIGVGGYFAVTQAADFLQIDSVNASSVDAAIEDTAIQTDTGGSTYDASGVSHAMDLPLASFSVLFRPLPFEAHNPQMLLAAAEGSFVMILLLRSMSSLALVPGRLRRQPYLLVCFVYSLIFIYAFSNFSNFGILTRERVQVLPFVLVFLCLRAKSPAPEPAAVHHDQISLPQGARP